MSLDENMHDAISELKRADHSIAVSLKYTRTVDVIKSIIERLINTISFVFETLIDRAIEEGKIEKTPLVARQKTELIRKLYPEDKFLKEIIDFYFTLRKILKSKFSRRQEFRRHVTMTADLEEGKQIEVTIDIITDYFNKVRELIDYVSVMMQNDKNDE